MEKNRAISENFLNKLKDKNEFKPFVDLVAEHDELCLCFRGIDSTVEIYRNNHQVFKLNEDGKLEISFNHARFSEKWTEYATLLKDYGFSEVKIKKIESKGKSPYYTANRLSCFYNKQIIVKELYTKVIKEIMNDFFSPFDKDPYAKKTERTDYFKKHYEANCLKPQKIECEKIRQQQLFDVMKDNKDGYFVYDLEFHEKGNPKGNEPDMLAIRFKDFIPVSLALIEVKSTASAMYGEHGIKTHIDSMKQFSITKNRKEEAHKILRHYKELRLYPNIVIDNLQAILNECFNKEILLILTDEAKEKWENPTGKNAKKIKKEKKELEENYNIKKSDVFSLPDSKKASVYIFEPKCK